GRPDRAQGHRGAGEDRQHRRRVAAPMAAARGRPRPPATQGSLLGLACAFHASVPPAARCVDSPRPGGANVGFLSGVRRREDLERAPWASIPPTALRAHPPPAWGGRIAGPAGVLRGAWIASTRCARTGARDPLLQPRLPVPPTAMSLAGGAATLNRRSRWIGQAARLLPPAPASSRLPPMIRIASSPARVLVLLSVLALAGCGFHLRDRIALP